MGMTLRIRDALTILLVLPAAVITACGRPETPAPRQPAPAASPAGKVVKTYGADQPISSEELERGRLDASWKRVVQVDEPLASATPAEEKLEQIAVESVNSGPMALPLSGDVEGPSVLRAQILLDRAFFSPGQIDGRWGKNTEKALYWLQKREGLRATGQLDPPTFERLRQLAGDPSQLVVRHSLTAEEVAGPFVEIPEDIYEAHKLKCTCYESLPEKLGERFHVDPAILELLNPGVSLNSLQAGARLSVPAVRDSGARSSGDVATIEVSVGGFYLHAKDAQGRLLYHFPATLGSAYDPSEGTVSKVTGVARDPWWHLQPEILHVGDRTRPDVKIPPGPNNAVGSTWIDLSKEHYGIHGTAEPGTIGYATSSGCVRLTNWDAAFLADRVTTRPPVRFKDIPPERREHQSHD